MAAVSLCSVPDDIKALLKKFRFRKEQTNAAIIFKIQKEGMKVVLDKQLEDCSVEELAAELPEHQPRYVAYSYCYTHGDGRVSYPLCFIFVSPEGSKPETHMMYTGSKTELVKEGDFTKDFEIRSTEDLTEEWLLEKLALFR